MDENIDILDNNVISLKTSCDTIRMCLDNIKFNSLTHDQRKQEIETIRQEIPYIMGDLGMVIEIMHDRIKELESRVKTFEKYGRRELNINP